MNTFHNPALTEESRNQPLKIVPPIPRETLLHWLDRTGKLRASESDEFQEQKPSEDLDDFLDPAVYASESEDDQQDLG
jgi:hypothetical protein